jgi:pimeloyl-ACP methyl ester carboxylesterase
MEESVKAMEAAMKTLQWLATVALVAAGVLLLIQPLSAQAPAKMVTVPVQFAPTRFTIVDAGTVGKPDVVLIPGLGSGRAVWAAEAKLLAPNYRLHLVQLNGFAGAPAGPNATGVILPAIVAELHQYIASNAMQPVMIGHSLGGLLTLMLAEQFPADVRKMVIVDTLPYYAVLFQPEATVATMQPQAAVLRQQIIAAPADQFALMQTAVVESLVKNEAGRTLVAAGDNASDRAAFANAMYDDLQTDLRGDIATIKTPMLLLYPYDATLQGADPAKVDAQYKSAYAAKPNLTLLRIDDSRHFIMYDQPAKLDAALEGFLK